MSAQSEQVRVEYDPPRDGFPGTWDVSIGRITATASSLDVALAELVAKVNERLSNYE